MAASLTAYAPFQYGRALAHPAKRTVCNHRAED
jgi:hypothetical protein